MTDEYVVTWQGATEKLDCYYRFVDEKTFSGAHDRDDATRLNREEAQRIANYVDGALGMTKRARVVAA